MIAHNLVITLTQDGNLVLKGLPFRAGESVEVIIRGQPQGQLPLQESQSAYPWQGMVIRYDDPFEPAVSAEEWDVFQYHYDN